MIGRLIAWGGVLLFAVVVGLEIGARFENLLAGMPR